RIGRDFSGLVECLSGKHELMMAWRPVEFCQTGIGLELRVLQFGTVTVTNVIGCIAVRKIQQIVKLFSNQTVNTGSGDILFIHTLESTSDLDTGAFTRTQQIGRIQRGEGNDTTESTTS